MTFYQKNELSETLYKFMKENYLCDVTIVALGGIRLCAHSVVLATVSNKLKAAFERTHAGGPSRRPNWRYRLTIEECSLESVQAILQFVYTGSIFPNNKAKSWTMDSNEQEPIVCQSTETMLNLDFAMKSKDIRTTHSDEKESKKPNALEILLAGQKLGLDPIKLARCLKFMMEDGSLNIEDATPLLLADEHIILDIVDKDPNAKTSFNLIETMCITSQMLPLVQEGERPASVDKYSEVQSLNAIENNSDRRAISNLTSFKNTPNPSNNFVLPVQFNISPGLKSNVKRKLSDCTSRTSLLVSNHPCSTGCHSRLNSLSGHKQLNNSEQCLLSRLLTKQNKMSKEPMLSGLCTNKSFENQISNKFCLSIGSLVVNSIIDDGRSRSFHRDLNPLNQDITSSETLDSLGTNKQQHVTANSKGKKKVKLVIDEKNSLVKTLRENVEVLSSERVDDIETILDKTGGDPEVKDVLSGRAPGDGKSYQCDVCGRSFARRYTAVEHKRLHSGEKPYQCDRCGKRFTTCGDLTKHKRSQHGTVKPHVCSICGKEMSTGREVADHKRLHEGGNRCPVCHKTFTRLHNMKEHLKGTHQGYRPFSCPYCDKKFAYSGSLRFHKKQHRLANQEELADECDIKASISEQSTSCCGRCGLKFSTEIDLITHDCPSNIPDESLKFPNQEYDNHLKKSYTLLQNESGSVFSDSEDINRFCSTTSNSTVGFIQSGSRRSIINEEVPRNDFNTQERIEVDSIQDQVLVDLALSGVIGFGSND